VALDAGYDSEAAFNRAFKREFGLPPGKYRKAHTGNTVRPESEQSRGRPAHSRLTRHETRGGARKTEGSSVTALHHPRRPRC
jgi:hypothetical protein